MRLCKRIKRSIRIYQSKIRYHRKQYKMAEMIRENARLNRMDPLNGD